MVLNMKSLSRLLTISVCFFSTAIAHGDAPLTNLDSYLQEHGFFLSPVNSNVNEGYCSEAQRNAYSDEIKKAPDIRNILEIGFNGGHSCETFLESSDKIKVISFDIALHPYTKIGAEFMQKKYQNRFKFVVGDSGTTVKAFAQSTTEKFDLIYIDGCHEYNHAVADIKNCQSLAHKDTIVLIDDYAPWGVKGAVDHCVNLGLIKILEERTVEDNSGIRAWAKVKYEYLTEAEKHFSDVYQNGSWGRNKFGEATSGPGSSLDQGLPFVRYVQNFLDSHDIQSIVDVGCGDWVLARQIYWGKRKYTGIDVVNSVIKKNKALYGSDTVQFLQLDAGLDSLPAGDLLICKDVLMHLPNSNVFHILNESKKFKYCIYINDIQLGAKNTDIPTFGFRGLDLTKPPFNLSPLSVDYYLSGVANKQVVLIQN